MTSEQHAAHPNKTKHRTPNNQVNRHRIPERTRSKLACKETRDKAQAGRQACIAWRWRLQAGMHSAVAGRQACMGHAVAAAARTAGDIGEVHQMHYDTALA